MPKTDHKAILVKGLTLKKPAVLVDLDEYEGMKETLEILQEDPNILKKLKKAETEIKKGKTTSWEKLKLELKLRP
ncbi:hypothetical protein ACFL52_04400 [Candidatus Margulisiibacteriota bacterium]